MYSPRLTELLLTNIKGVSALSDQEMKPIVYEKRVKHGNQRGRKERRKENKHQAERT